MAHASANTLAEAIRLLASAGLLDYNGHCSLRTGPNSLLINTRKSVRARVSAADLVEIDLIACAFQLNLTNWSNPHTNFVIIFLENGWEMYRRSLLRRQIRHPSHARLDLGTCRAPRSSKHPTVRLPQ